MRKTLSFLLILTLIVVALPTDARALDNSPDSNIITFEDGSYIRITVEEVFVRATNTKNGYKTYSYYDASNNLDWQAKLSAIFLIMAQLPPALVQAVPSQSMIVVGLKVQIQQHVAAVQLPHTL